MLPLQTMVPDLNIPNLGMPWDRGVFSVRKTA